MLRVNEIFDSLQGEGTQVGRLTTFVRLQGCNLDCPWCDTSLAKQRSGRGFVLDEDSIVKEIRHPLVTLTGGEPLLQNIVKLLTILKMLKREIHIETNGTFPERIGELCSHIDFWSISPKQQAQREAAEFIRLVATRHLPAQIKFVIQSMDEMKNRDDMMWAKAFIESLGCIRLPIVFQPCWMDPIITYLDRSKYDMNFKRMAFFVKQRWPDRDIRVIPQMHKLFKLDRICHRTLKDGRDT